MSSTYKTTNLGLNQFVGSDRPKMEDFNFDNQQIDQKFQEHVLSNLHLTEQQREQLGKASYQIGSYSGDGQASRTIAVEGEIGFGLIFMVGEVFNQTVTSSGDTYVYAAIITPQGCSKAAAVEAVLDMLGRSFDDAAAIGDGGIDVQLIRRSGLGVTLENGSAECRQAAQLIVPGCEQEGCMTLIEALIAQKERGKTR